MDILAIATAFLEPYTRNTNTGNCYEIFTGLNFLRRMGLDSLTPLDALFTQIKACNKKHASKIDDAIAACGSVGTGLTVHSKKVVNLRNVTQDDGDGGTGDIILIMEDGEELSVSVFEGNIKPDGSVDKCLSNPTCKRYGCTEDDIVIFKKTAADTVPIYKAEMTTKYGADEEAWYRMSSQASETACSSVATITATRFNGLDASDRSTRISDLLYIGDITKPADILCVVNDKFKKYTLFDIAPSNITLANPTLVADGRWLRVMVDGREIGKTQVKFNSAIYSKGKTSPIHSSWNAWCHMDKVFNLTPLI
jgi:hypothetical protein